MRQLSPSQIKLSTVSVDTYETGAGEEDQEELAAYQRDCKILEEWCVDIHQYIAASPDAYNDLF